MKVTIDTKEDSHEDIYKILQILTNILNKREVSNETTTNNSVDTSNMMSMFDHSSEKKEIADTPPDFSSLLKLTSEGQETRKVNLKPRVEIF